MEFSPSSEFIAISKARTITVFETTQLNNVATFTSDEIVSGIEWSSDSEFLMAVCKKTGCVKIYAV